MDSNLIQDLIKVINLEYSERQRKNSRYSLRAYARYLGLDVSHLSKFLQGKKGLSRARLISLGKKLNLGNPWLIQVQTVTPRGKKPTGVYHELDELQFRKMYHWYYSAVFELPLLKGFQPNPLWIAKTLQITTEQAEGALSALHASGLLNNRLGAKKTTMSRPLSMSYYRPGQTSQERRENQRQLLGKAIEALDEVPIEWREQSSMIMATNTKNLEKARLLTKKFRRDMDRLMSKGKNCQDIYALNISLFPLTRNFPSVP